MEDEDKHSLQTHKDTENILSWKVDLLRQTAGTNEPKGPAQPEKNRENYCYAKMAKECRVGSLGGRSNHGEVATEGDHDDNEHEPVEDINDTKWKDESKPEWPLVCPATVMIKSKEIERG